MDHPAATHLSQFCFASDSGVNGLQKVSLQTVYYCTLCLMIILMKRGFEHREFILYKHHNRPKLLAQRMLETDARNDPTTPQTRCCTTL